VRTPAVNQSLENTLTRQRLDKYLAATNSNLDGALKLYEENTRLSKAFYTPLQCVEVCLRNAIHKQLAIKFAVDWFQNGRPPFTADTQSMIGDAIRGLSTGVGAIGSDDVVAELKFAFWVGLLGQHYDNTLWRGALYRAFLAKGGRPRKIVHGRFNVIRRFRNRVMHHEPIFHRPLQQLHDEIIEAIEWICPDTARWAAFQSRYDEVATASPSPNRP
jgi:hypothetical protein